MLITVRLAISVSMFERERPRDVGKRCKGGAKRRNLEKAGDGKCFNVLSTEV